MSENQNPSTVKSVEALGAVKKNTNLTLHVPEKWEIDAIGDFLSDLYKRQIISKSKDWILLKERMRYEYAMFLRQPGNEHLEKGFLELNGTADIGTLLFRTKFLINTPRGSACYRIRNMSLYMHLDRKIEDIDKKRKNVIGDGEDNSGDKCENVHSPSKVDDENNEPKFLNYEGSELQIRKLDFSLEKPGCCVCQLNFKNDLEFADHIALHSEESNFELGKNLTKFDASIFKISYKPCKNSHILCFTLQTRLPKVIIERIIIVQSRSFHYLNNTRVPYVIDGTGNFYVNSQFFTEYLEQPIIILFHANSKDMRLMEQHNFVNFNPFPIVQMHFNPQYLSQESKFEPHTTLLDYEPEDDVVKSLKYDFPTEYLIKIRPEFYDYIAEDKKFNMDNMHIVLKLLIQMEVLAVRRANYLLLQRDVKLRKCEEVYSIKLKYISLSTEIAGGRFQHLPETDDEIFLVEEKAIENIIIFQNLIDNGFESLLKYIEKKNTFVGRVKRSIEGRVLFVSEQNIPLNKSYIAIVRPSCVYLRYQQRALETLDFKSSNIMRRVIFPQIVNRQKLPSNNLVLQNEGIRNDEEQLQAVRNITAESKIDAPYIIVGGPGTGKTTVLVESILYLYLRRPNTKILVVAGTDSSCDEIALRLCKVLYKMHDSLAIVRLYDNPSMQRREKIDELLLEYSNFYAEQHFIPAINVLHEFRILVCTIKMVGHLSLGNFGKTATEYQSVFTHVFMDDAAALTEPESLVGVVGILTEHTKLVLAGSLQQPDSLLYSERARDLGLNVSLFERLLSRDCYRTDEGGCYNRSILTKLNRNYRSHPKIMELYNRSNDDIKMTSSVPKKIVSLYERWYRMANPNFPIIFNEVNCSNDSKYASWQEVEIILNYIKDLIYNGVNECKIAQKDIGIITPYKKQALHIQDQLHLRGWYQIEVGLPENFQGKEKSIVFISFVWASSNSLDILNNEKLLNFMISRAKSLLILVGNSKALNQNIDIKNLIDECRKNKTLEFRNLFWQEPQQHHGTLNNELTREKNESSDDDDLHSQCSDVSATVVQKKKRNRNKKGKPTAASQDIANPLPNNGANDSANNKQDVQNQNKNQNKSNKDKKTSESQYSNELLKMLPRAPTESSMEAEIKKRIEKLNLNANTAPKHGTSANLATNPSNPKAPNKKGCKNPTPVQIKQGNVAGGGGGHNQAHVKRLNNKPMHQGGQSHANNNTKKNEEAKKPINMSKGNAPQNGNKTVNLQGNTPAVTPVATTSPQPQQNVQPVYFQPQPPIIVHMPPHVRYPSNQYYNMQGPSRPQFHHRTPNRENPKAEDKCTIA